MGATHLLWKHRHQIRPLSCAQVCGGNNYSDYHVLTFGINYSFVVESWHGATASRCIFCIRKSSAVGGVHNLFLGGANAWLEPCVWFYIQRTRHALTSVSCNHSVHNVASCSLSQSRIGRGCRHRIWRGDGVVWMLGASRQIQNDCSATGLVGAPACATAT